MIRRFLQALTLMAPLGLGTLVFAGTIHTPPIGRNPATEDDVLCLVSNTSTNPIGPLSVRVIRPDGLTGNTMTVESLEPRTTLRLRVLKPSLGSTGGVFCEVDGKGVSRHRTPTTLCVVANDSDTCLGTVSVP